VGVDYFDIFYSHRFDLDTPLEETMGALATAVRQGKALYVGISSYSATRHARRPISCARRGTAADPPAVVQPVQPVGRAGASRCARGHRRRDDRVHGRRPGAAHEQVPRRNPADARINRPGGDSFEREMLSEQNLARVRALNEIALRRGQTLAQMAYAWVLRDPRSPPR